MQQELDHVVFGEQLRHGRQRAAVDLVAALVHLFLPARLPELVDPAQAIVGQERFAGQAGQQLFRGQPLFRCELDVQQHVVGAKNLGQHPASVAGREDEPVRRPFGLGQLVALRETDRHAVGVHQQVVFGQEPGEQHAVPVFVGQFLGQLVDTLGLLRVVAHVARLAAAGAEPGPQLPVGGGKMRERLGGVDRPFLECGPGRGFGHVAGRDAGVFELSAKVRGQCGHGGRTSYEGRT